MNRDQLGAVLRNALGSPQFTSALTTASIGTALLGSLTQRLIGWPGYLAIVACLVMLAGASLVVQWRRIEWSGLLPVSLLLFLGWATVSVFWSEYSWASASSVVYLLSFTLLGVYISLMRDTIQIIRAFGDALRLVLAVSLAIEIFAGLLIDSPIPFLGVTGGLANFSPIEGVMQSRNQLGFVAVIGAITFATEFRTRSLPRDWAIISLVLAGLCIILVRSPVIVGVVLVVIVGAAALYGLRRVRPERRRFWQFTALVLAVVGSIIAWVFRARIIENMSAGGVFNYRVAHWQQIWNLIPRHPLEGWGWIGRWRPEIQPFPAFKISDGGIPGSALNSFLDVWFQLGLIGLAIFVVLVGLAFVRSWLLAGQRRSIVFAWPALVLVALISASLFESIVLVEYGWLLFVVCCVKAASELSWRRALRSSPDPTV